MADNEIVVEVKAKIDDIEKKLAGLEKKAKETGDSIGAKLSAGVENFTGVSVAQFAAAGAAIGAAAFTIKKALDFALEGEALKNLDVQFEFLAKAAGLAGENLKEALRSKAGGLVDDTDIIQSASRGIVALGESAKHLPETFGLARKASALFGGEVTANFELINTAVATGNARSLRQIGIIVDNEKAQKNYALSLGATVSSLTEAGRKQAVLNAIIEEGEKRYSGIDPEINKTRNSTQRLIVALTDLKENFQKVTAEATGGFFQAISDGLTSIAVSGSDLLKKLGGTGKLAINEQLEILHRDLVAAEQATISFNRAGEIVNEDPSIAKAKIDAIRLKISLLDEERRKIESLASTKAQIDASEEESPETKKFSPEKVAAENAAISAKIASQNALTVSLQKEGLSEYEANEAQSKANIMAAEAQFLADKTALLAQAAADETINKTLLDQQIVAMEANKNARVAAFQAQGVATARVSAEALKALTKTIIVAVADELVRSLQKGQFSLQAFGKVLLGILGDFAIQTGATILATGIAYAALGDFTGTSPIMFGAALLAIGVLLKSLSGGGGGGGGAEAAASSGGGGAGGASLAGGSSGVAFTDQDAARARGTQVNVNVQGNVLDRRESGLAIAEVIQEHFDNSGTVISRAGAV